MQRTTITLFDNLADPVKEQMDFSISHHGRLNSTTLTFRNNVQMLEVRLTREQFDWFKLLFTEGYSGVSMERNNAWLGTEFIHKLK